jgi:hypothetical protein
MTEIEDYSSRERLLSPEELAECVTRQKEFNLPNIGSKVRASLKIVKYYAEKIYPIFCSPTKLRLKCLIIFVKILDQSQLGSFKLKI